MLAASARPATPAPTSLSLSLGSKTMSQKLELRDMPFVIAGLSKWRLFRQVETTILYGSKSHRRDSASVTTNGFARFPCEFMHKKLKRYATRDEFIGRGYGSDSRKMEYCVDTELQRYENEYARLKLGKNVLNFFNVSHKLGRARVDKSKVDEFEEFMDMGMVLLKEGEQGLDGRLEVGVAARMLKEAAARFAAASAMDPSSVAAVDACGTTLLAHGKLKLLLNEKLRDMLLEARAPRKELHAETTVATLEDMIPTVCEECEKLLVEAGRKFGKAVSMDKSSASALYNWGLALFYRARLIAEDGLEDAIKDADEIYMTAVDKFKLTIEVSKEYSGAAYLSWGLALRDRYWLHGLASNKDIRLLEQAKWACERALQANPYGLEEKLVMRACKEELAQFQTK